MTIAKALTTATIMLAPFHFSSSAKAALVAFSFTGTGANGSLASGAFTTDDGILYPGYFSTGGIYPSLALSISGIPGGGPSSVSFSLSDIYGSWFNVDSSSVAYISPYGSKDYGAPGFNHYDLGQPSQPFLPSQVFQTVLSYNGSPRDTITWSPAAVVPEPAAGFLSLWGAVLGLRRRAPGGG